MARTSGNTKQEIKMKLQECRNGEQAEGLKDLISDLPSDIVMAEIGVWRGEAAMLFLDSGKVKKYYGVDIWRTGDSKIAEREFDNKVKGRNALKIRMDMSLAIHKLPILDFVYIDGSHTYKSVKNDIRASLRVVKKGIIGGHDYADKYKDRVVKAVDEMLGCPDKVYKDSSWIKYIK